MQFGDPDIPLSFSVPIKLVLSGQAGKKAFITESTTVEITTICNSDDPILVTNLPTSYPKTCKLDSGDDLIIITANASVFSTGTVSNDSGASSDGDGNGDDIAPSVFTGFTASEYPISINDNHYTTEQLSSIPLTSVESGTPLELILRLYENQGSQNIGHVELYVNQKNNIILNDLTETGIIYDIDGELIILDPYDLITSADVVQSVEGNKSVFTFEIIFSKDIDYSNILFRAWDYTRNSVNVYLPTSLNVLHSPELIMDPEPTLESLNEISSVNVFENSFSENTSNDLLNSIPTEMPTQLVNPVVQVAEVAVTKPIVESIVEETPVILFEQVNSASYVAKETTPEPVMNSEPVQAIQCGVGMMVVDGFCQLDKTVVENEVQCGVGMMVVDGFCKLDSSAVVATTPQCGPGTEAVNGVCELIPESDFFNSFMKIFSDLFK